MNGGIVFLRCLITHQLCFTLLMMLLVSDFNPNYTFSKYVFFFSYYMLHLYFPPKLDLVSYVPRLYFLHELESLFIWDLVSYVVNILRIENIIE